LGESVSAERRAGLKDHSLPARLASATGLGALALVSVWRGGALFAFVLSMALLAAVAEFLLMAQRAGHRVLLAPTLVLAIAILFYGMMPVIPGASIVFLLLALWFILDVLWRPAPERTVGLALSFLGLLYVLGLGMHLEWLRDETQGAGRVFAVLFGTWAADTTAFFAGLRWGRHRLAPSISPGKTVEGAVAGWIAAVLVTASVWNLWVRPGDVAGGILIGAVVGIGALLGDLLESMMKRNFQMKDASHLIPGHGGVLDRIDGLLLAGAAAYYVSRLIAP
jgi:phosphatidate cytidylyltransferase